MSLTKTQKEKVTQFMSFTNTSRNSAITTLKSVSWNSDRAINKFFNDQEHKKRNTSNKKSKSTSSRRTSYGSVKVSRPKLNKLFEKYSENSEEINPEGVETFLSDCGIGLMDIEALILSWHLCAEKMGSYSKEEFCDGLYRLKCDSVQALKKRKSTFLNDIQNDNKFKEFYNFVFTFAKEDPRHKFLSIDIGIFLWKLLLPKRFKLLDKWLEYLQIEENNKKTISEDLWKNILHFSKNVKTLEDYDPFEAYPVMIDEFVEWLQEQN
ncbi:rp42 related [Anaeramoeba flamelloides]|uniref:Defective in cullin neddylation protein n=1 Tax=Anaeramoeba flamelloides TaxID=1746091 RepID=A0AAV8AJ99_9EUKA|nr:rp42 related [Anaeramoeba flamelloides]